MPNADTLDKQLKDFNCPYKPDDPRCSAWLKGYAAGFNEGTEIAIKRLEELMNRPLR